MIFANDSSCRRVSSQDMSPWSKYQPNHSALVSRWSCVDVALHVVDAADERVLRLDHAVVGERHRRRLPREAERLEEAEAAEVRDPAAAHDLLAEAVGLGEVAPKWIERNAAVRLPSGEVESVLRGLVMIGLDHALELRGVGNQDPRHDALGGTPADRLLAHRERLPDLRVRRGVGLRHDADPLHGPRLVHFAGRPSSFVHVFPTGQRWMPPSYGVGIS